jgi:hypothetical protein
VHQPRRPRSRIHALGAGSVKAHSLTVPHRYGEQVSHEGDTVELQPTPVLQAPSFGHRNRPSHDCGPTQLASQAHEVEQSMTEIRAPGAQVRSALHSRLQRPVPQVTVPPQARDPSQRTVHSVAEAQLMPPPHDRSPSHSTTHSMPAGQTIVPGHESSASQKTTQTLLSQVLQGDGQGAPSMPLSMSPGWASMSPLPGTTHQPLTHTRSSAQSLGTSQR